MSAIESNEQRTERHAHAGWKRTIALFLGGQTISLFGSALVQYAMMWHLTLSTNSGVMMTIYILCGFLPTFLLSPFAGVWADRYNRKAIIVLADSTIAVATLVLALLMLSGYDALWLFFLMAAIRALGTGVQGPAVGAVLPQIVPENMLTKMNGLYGSIQSLVTLLSPIVSAALLDVAPIETIFFVDVATAAIAIFIMLTLVRIPIHAKAALQQQIGFFADMRQGLAYIRNHRFVMQLLSFFAIFFVLAAPVAFLTPLQVTRSFGTEYWRLTAIEIAFSIGMMLGGLLIASWGGLRNRVHTLVLSGFLFGIFTFALGVVPSFWAYLAFMAIIGVAMPIFNTPSTVLLQEKVDNDYLGRVFGVLGMVSTSMMPLGMLVFGPIADYVAIEWLLIGTGIGMFLLSIVILGNKSFVRAGEPADGAAAAGKPESD